MTLDRYAMIFRFRVESFLSLYRCFSGPQPGQGDLCKIKVDPGAQRFVPAGHIRQRQRTRQGSLRLLIPSQAAELASDVRELVSDQNLVAAFLGRSVSSFIML